MLKKLKFKIEEAAVEVGVESTLITAWIENEWVIPSDREDELLDLEDMARIRLIRSLIDELEVNDQGVSVVLHVLDQLHRLMHELGRGI